MTGIFKPGVNMLKSNVSKSIFLISWPLVTELFLQMSIGWIDVFMISRRLGKFALASTGISNNLIGIVTVVMAVLSVGSSVLISQYIGAKNFKRSTKVFEQSLFFMISTSIITGALLISTGRTLLLAMGAEPQLVSMGYKYLVYIVSFLPIQASMGLMGSALRSTGDTKSPMKAAIIVNILNTLLNAAALYGFDLGIGGVAVASGLSRTVGLVLLIYVTFRKDFVLDYSFKNILRLDFEVLKEILRIGLPSAVEQISYRGNIFILNIIILRFGTSIVASAQLSGQIEAISFVPAVALSMAVSILVGQNIGRGDVKSAQETAKFTWIISTAFMTLVGLIFIIFAPNLISIFTNDKELIKIGSIVLRMVALAQPAKAFNISLNGAFRGAGDTLWVMVVTIIGTWSLSVGLAFLLGVVFNFGIYGVWAAIVIDEWARGVANVIYLYRGKWKNKKIVV